MTRDFLVKIPRLSVWEIQGTESKSVTLLHLSPTCPSYGALEHDRLPPSYFSIVAMWQLSISSVCRYIKVNKKRQHLVLCET